MAVGHTLGEEVLYSPDRKRGMVRTESVFSQDNSCVLQISLKTFTMMRSQKQLGASSKSLLKDYHTLNFILESHYLQKNDWRACAGLCLPEDLKMSAKSRVQPDKPK